MKIFILAALAAIAGANGAAAQNYYIVQPNSYRVPQPADPFTAMQRGYQQGQQQRMQQLEWESRYRQQLMQEQLMRQQLQQKQPHAAPNSAPRSFAGKVCTDGCQGHAAGYKWAQSKRLAKPADCLGHGNGSASFFEGCVAFTNAPKRGYATDDAGVPIKVR